VRPLSANDLHQRINFDAISRFLVQSMATSLDCIITTDRCKSNHILR